MPSRQYLEAARDLNKLIPVAKDRIAKRAEFREKFDKDYYDGLAKQLKSEQLQRLGQIRLQAEAPASLALRASVPQKNSSNRFRELCRLSLRR